MEHQSLTLDEIRLQEKLMRQLRGTKAMPGEEGVRDYFAQIITPPVSAAGIHQLSILLLSRNGEVVTAEMQEGYLGEREVYVRLVEAISGIKCSYFSLKTDEGMVAGYSENDWDWVVLKYEEEAQTFIETILMDFWIPFFDF